MDNLNSAIIESLRKQARQGHSVSQMFNELRRVLNGNKTHIVDILAHFRGAFCLGLKEVKPIAELSRSEGREIIDETLLENLIMPEIEKNRSEWDVSTDQEQN